MKNETNIITVETTENQVNNSVDNIAKIKSAKKALNEMLSIEYKILMQNVNQLMDEQKLKEPTFSNKSNAKIVLSNINMQSNTALISNDILILIGLMANGLTIHYNLKFSSLKSAFKNFKSGLISKSAFNDLTKLLVRLDEIKVDKMLTNAQKLVNENLLINPVPKMIEN